MRAYETKIIVFFLNFIIGFRRLCLFKNTSRKNDKLFVPSVTQYQETLHKVLKPYKDFIIFLKPQLANKTEKRRREDKTGNEN